MLEPRPRVVVINEGLWADVNLSDETVVRMIRDTIRDLGMVSVYRTTTKRTGQAKISPGSCPTTNYVARYLTIVSRWIGQLVRRNAIVGTIFTFWRM